MQDFPYKETLEFEFKKPEYARIAARSLSVDDDLKPQESSSQFYSFGTSLIMSVQAISEKHLKKAINTTTPSIKFIQEIIDTFAIR